MPTFRLPVVWTMMGYRNVEAPTLEEACKMVMEENEPLPEGNYLDESFGLDGEGVREQVKNDDQLRALNALPEDYWK